MFQRLEISEIFRSGMVYHLCGAIFLFCCTLRCASLNSKRFSKHKCYEDCQWIEVMNKCIDCETGFYGRNCSSPCRYPNYGKACQLDCSHYNLEECNSTLGCLSSDVPTSQDYNTSKESSIRLKYIIIGLITSGFFATFIIIAYVYKMKRQSFENERNWSSFVQRLRYY
ncbi:uncharacterized protein LOC128185425 [Crassostrea angulata]|uniref:uncharacterized protein LOC128185425 n=1 Tax=Magallana angulata TaxID=2784310 RepID=UPI0022B20D8C|nr:uncharacterized protein LOC128185425 [Crassostrea angulata]